MASRLVEDKIGKFRLQENSASAPVLLFLPGGPGLSMAMGLLMEHGPFSVALNGSLETRIASWNKKHNVIYIDSPVGTGWSFTDSEEAYARSQPQIGDELLQAMLQFFQLFPALRGNDFFVTGESYAGKFVPVLSSAIHVHNVDASEDKKINLKGMVIANGFTDPLNQLVYGEFLYALGLVDANGRDEFLALEQQTRDLILQDQHAAADVRRALHVGNNNFTFVSHQVRQYLEDDLTRSQVHLVASLLQDYRVLIYTGNLDVVCSSVSVQNYLGNLSWSGAQEFRTVRRQHWRTSDGELAGYVKKFGNLVEVTVRNAGHFPSLDQPERILELLEKFTGESL
ncbi:venom serine carboxypeptidase-like [Venturia canescens]|uniref:venom serine carboxypeptidase-like n=1 Tax=Venturia canescens TaxID=32260 RepID=UPI001C9C6A1A|nr:venom serine carboxypeptidase-like [Venturia canescens]